VLLHRLLPIVRTDVVHKINPFLSLEVLHFRSPISLTVVLSAPQRMGKFNVTRGIRGIQAQKNIDPAGIS
jgi:hypothetical protein